MHRRPTRALVPTRTRAMGSQLHVSATTRRRPRGGGGRIMQFGVRCAREERGVESRGARGGARVSLSYRAAGGLSFAQAGRQTAVRARARVHPAVPSCARMAACPRGAPRGAAARCGSVARAGVRVGGERRGKGKESGYTGRAPAAAPRRPRGARAPKTVPGGAAAARGARRPRHGAPPARIAYVKRGGARRGSVGDMCIARGRGARGLHAAARSKQAAIGAPAARNVRFAPRAARTARAAPQRSTEGPARAPTWAVAGRALRPARGPRGSGRRTASNGSPAPCRRARAHARARASSGPALVNVSGRRCGSPRQRGAPLEEGPPQKRSHAARAPGRPGRRAPCSPGIHPMRGPRPRR